MATTITSPQADYTDDVVFGDGTRLSFKDGKAEIDELPDAIRSYLRGAGYGIDSDPEERDEPIPPDPREVGAGTVVGTNLRDAAVDPEPDDFLPPINAGKEGDEGNPHGPNVVAPQIHASTGQAVVPGPVGKYVEIDTTTVSALTGEEVEGKIGVVEPDPEVQQERESEYAERVLAGNELVPDVTADMGGATPTGEGDSLTPAPEGLKGRELDKALEERGLAKSGTAEEKRQRLADYDADQVPGNQSTADIAEAEGLVGDADDQAAAEAKLQG